MAIEKIEGKNAASSLLMDVFSKISKDHPTAHAAIFEALGETRDSRAVDFLCAQIANPQDDLYELSAAPYAAEELGKIGDRRAVPTLLPVLQNDARRKELCIASAFALYRMGDTELAPSFDTNS